MTWTCSLRCCLSLTAAGTGRSSSTIAAEVLELPTEGVHARGNDPLDLSHVDAAVEAGERRYNSEADRIAAWLSGGGDR